MAGSPKRGRYVEDFDIARFESFSQYDIDELSEPIMEMDCPEWSSDDEWVNTISDQITTPISDLNQQVTNVKVSSLYEVRYGNKIEEVATALVMYSGTEADMRAKMKEHKTTPTPVSTSETHQCKHQYQPRCFSKIKPETLPVMYCNNKKAWMNSSLFESWLSKFNNRMKRQNRHVLLFVDNAPSHPNVKLLFLPPNTTSKSQPMDQGIIQTLKLKFRKRQLQHVIYEMEKDKSKCGSQLLKDITILQAIYWIHRSWQKVETTTIQKCFAKCGFQDLASQHLSDDSDSDYDQDDNVPLKVVSMARQLFGCDFQELVQLDQHMSTCDQNVRDWSKSANELLADLDGPSLSDNDEDTDVEPQQKAPCTLSELDFYISEIKNFALVNGRQRMLDSVMEIEEDVVVQRIKVVKQCLISDFMQ